MGEPDAKDKNKPAFDKYHKSFANHPKLKADFDHLEVISRAFNFLIDGDLGQAQATFEKVKLIPIQEGDKDTAHMFSGKFQALDSRMQWLMLDVVTAAAKCIYILAMRIIHQEHDYLGGAGGLEFGSSTNSQKNRRDLKKRSQQVQNLGTFIECVIQSECYRKGRGQPESESQLMEQRLSQIGAMIRKINMEIL